MRVHHSFPVYRRFDPAVTVWDLTAGLRGCFHRFFDTWPISPSGRYAAVLRIADEVNLPSPGDAAEVVVIDLWEGRHWVAAVTRGWEPQMGANINWGIDDHHLVFNDVDQRTWTPMLVVADPLRGTANRTPGGVYQVSPDGRYAAAASMERMRRTQYGYGVVIPDDRVAMNVGAPDDDGLFITDLQTGERKLVLPLSEAVKHIPELDDPQSWCVFGFHSKWSPDGRRLIFTIRRWRRGHPSAAAWNNIGCGEDVLRFDVLTCRPDGGDVHDAVTWKSWLAGGHHINWFPDSQQLSMNLGGFGDGLRFVRVGYDGSDLRPILRDVRGSGHPSVHPSGRILTDTYTSESMAFSDGSVPLRWIDMRSGEERTLVRIGSRVEGAGHSAMRVDAHPAWDRTWRYVAFNGVDDNTRHVYLADMAAVLEQ